MKSTPFDSDGTQRHKRCHKYASGGEPALTVWRGGRSSRRASSLNRVLTYCWTRRPLILLLLFSLLLPVRCNLTGTSSLFFPLERSKRRSQIPPSLPEIECRRLALSPSYSGLPPPMNCSPPFISHLPGVHHFHLLSFLPHFSSPNPNTGNCDGLSTWLTPRKRLSSTFSAADGWTQLCRCPLGPFVGRRHRTHWSVPPSSSSISLFSWQPSLPGVARRPSHRRRDLRRRLFRSI